jgi:argininosuccinate synthase
MRTIQPRVSGSVRLKLFKGDCRVVGRRSPLAIEAEAPNANLQPPTSEGSVH